MGFPTVQIGPVAFSDAPIDDAVESAVRNAAAGHGQNLRFSNAYCVGLADSDEEYRRALESPGQNFADGLPVAWLLRKKSGRGGPLSSFRVRGPTFFEDTIAAGCSRQLRHSFVGATPSTLASLVEWIRTNHPGAVVAGTYAPPFSPVNDELIEGICERIDDHNPHIVWLGLGTPKQDLTAMKLAVRYPHLTFASVGAAFDFKAGVTREAPSWVQSSGLEWLYRFMSEPRRLWHRYTVGSFRFFKAVLSPRSTQRND